MEAWRDTWRRGVAPLLSTGGLEALRVALVRDEPALLQGETTRPLALSPDYSEPVAGACALGYAGWRGDGLETVLEVEQFFSRVCWEIDQRMGYPAASRHFLDWFDLLPRGEMRRELLVEVQRALARRLGDEPDVPVVVSA